MKTKLLLLITCCLLISCNNITTNIDKPTYNSNNSSNRIKGKEHNTLYGREYTIIQVDSVEFLTGEKGGFIRLTK
jgi:hypothetical protein